jgi:hypothetical protein
MFPSLAANLLVLLHLGFVLFAALGGLLVLKWRHLAWLHLPCVAWGAWIEFSGSICPLTPLEVAFRQRAGEAGYRGGFIEHYLWPILYPDAITREMQMGLGVFLLLLNTAVYVWVIRSHRNRQPG